MKNMILITLREVWRKKVLLLAFLMTALFLTLYAVGLAKINWEDGAFPLPAAAVAGQMTGLAVFMAGFISAFLAVFTAAGTMAGEIESGVLQAVVPKPLRRFEVVLGKFLGLAVICAVFNAILLSAILFFTRIFSGQVPRNVMPALGLFCLQPLLLLAVTFLGSMRLTQIAAGVGGVLLYTVGVIGGSIGQIGALLGNASLTGAGAVSSYLMPADALYRLIYSLLTPRTGMADFGPFGAKAPASPWMAAYAAAYALCLLAFSIRVFSRKDL